MQLIVFLEHRFQRTPDGQVWTQMALPYSVWKPYLDVFEAIKVVARIEEVLSIGSESVLASGDRLTFAPTPYFIGPLQFLIKSWAVRKSVEDVIDSNSAILLRLPGMIGTTAGSIIRRANRPYAVQIVGDPSEVFSKGAIKHPLRNFFRSFFTYQLKMLAKRATVISYVTAKKLQQKYPSGSKYSHSFSDVDLPKDVFANNYRSEWTSLGTIENPWRLILVGSLEQMYKGHDILLKAMSICLSRNMNLKLKFVGDGKYRTELEHLARDLRIDKYVDFVGQLPSGDAVRNQLDQADIFILPSLTEGLPRAMLEAMARGLPCIGSNVGGIPELLREEDLVPSGDVTALADLLYKVLNSPIRLTEMSSRNLEKSKEYSDSTLAQRRTNFYQDIKIQTEDWIKTGGNIK